MSACRRQYPGRTDGTVHSCSPIDGGLPSILGGSAPASPVSGPAQRSLSLRPTNSPSRQSDPLHQRLQQLRHLRYCSDCYRVERTVPGRDSPAVDQRLFTAHEKCRLRRQSTLLLAASGMAHGVRVIAPAVCSELEKLLTQKSAAVSCVPLNSPSKLGYA